MAFCFRLIIILSLLLPISLLAQNNSNNIANSYQYYNDIFPEFTAPKIFSSYHRNYFLLLGAPAKFQISFKYKLIYDKTSDNATGFYVAYTHLGMWHLTDPKDLDLSNPFVDNNFKPEAFYLFDFRKKIPWYSLQVGYMHDSNGIGGREVRNSVAWDHIYLENQFHFSFGNSYLFINLRVWLPLGMDDNLDILEYYGIGSLGITYKTIFADSIGLEIELMLRKGMSLKKLDRGAIQFIVSLGPFFVNEYAIPIGIVFEVWNGYGESLRFYKTSYTKVRLGLSLLLF